MGIRESLNSRPIIALSGLAALIVGAGVFVLANMKPGVASAVAGQTDWFTTDDGKTFFADSSGQQPPFEYNGKIAYRCRIYTCDGGKTKFVSHLERLTANAKKKYEAVKNDVIRSSAELVRIEVKAPLTGDHDWVNVDSPAGQALIKPRCPNGGNGLPDLVRP